MKRRFWQGFKDRVWLVPPFYNGPLIIACRGFCFLGLYNGPKVPKGPWAKNLNPQIPFDAEPTLWQNVSAAEEQVPLCAAASQHSAAASVQNADLWYNQMTN